MRRPFLPTPSARRATTLFLLAADRAQDFYPRPPRGGRRSGGTEPDGFQKISTHALREEGDGYLLSGRAVADAISTHALREEGDGCSRLLLPRPTDFYPRPPRGGRPGHNDAAGLQFAISTHALREEGDAIDPPNDAGYIISTHALREEGDERWD